MSIRQHSTTDCSITKSFAEWSELVRKCEAVWSVSVEDAFPRAQRKSERCCAALPPLSSRPVSDRWHFGVAGVAWTAITAINVESVWMDWLNQLRWRAVDIASVDLASRIGRTPAVEVALSVKQKVSLCHILLIGSIDNFVLLWSFSEEKPTNKRVVPNQCPREPSI